MSAAVQVFSHERKQVGLFHVADIQALRAGHEFRVNIDPSRRYVALKVERRGYSVSNYDMARSREASERIEREIQRNVPTYATCDRDIATDRTIWSWPSLLCPDIEVAALLFDHEDFEPVGEPCSASMSEQMWWRHYGEMTPDEKAYAAGGDTISRLAEAYREEMHRLPDAREFDSLFTGSHKRAVPAYHYPSLHDLSEPGSIKMPMPEASKAGYDWKTESPMVVTRPMMGMSPRITGV